MENYVNKLNELKENSSFRTIKNIIERKDKFIKVDDALMLNLSSNDYLNISTNKDLISEFIDKNRFTPEFLFSSASARLLTGNSKAYFELENNIKKLYNKEAALLFNTGYQCNQGVVSTLFSSKDCIFCDKLIHASVVSGLKLSPAQHFRYPHNNYEMLEKMLIKNRNQFDKVIIITESVFSMDGDCADLEKLIELKKKYNCMLMVDEAHAFGVFGENAQGLSAKNNLFNDIDIITITLGKALGSMGAVCISNKTIIDYLINKASSFIFSTVIPPVNVLWSNFLLTEKFDFILKQKEKLNDLFSFAHKIYPSISSSQIIPVVLKDSKKTFMVSDVLQKQGYYVLPINPPTVPNGQSRLRVSLTSDIEKAEIQRFFELVKKESEKIDEKSLA